MELTLNEVKPIITYIINNNKKLAEKKQPLTAVNIVGEAGIGKTSILEQIAEELNYNFVKLNLAQITETSDMVGYPTKEHYICAKDGSECKWITSELVDAYARSNWEITEKTRMGYAVPAWLAGLDPNKGTILLLDDFQRAQPHIIASCYELIYKQEYISWRLPEGSTVVLSNNPDDGNYDVTSIDSALASRMVSFNVKFDLAGWAQYAETQELENRTINFFLSYAHELTARKNGNAPVANARSYTMFANIISGIKDWEKPESLEFIMNIASGCFLDKDNIVGSLFTQFVADRLDKLISPEDMLMEKWETAKNRIKDCVWRNESRGQVYHPEIASILQTRLLNYACHYFSKPGAKTSIVEDRILALIDASNSTNPNDKLFSEDLLFDICKTLIKLYPNRCNKFMINSKIRSKITL